MLNRAETPENPQKKSGLRCRAHGEFSAWLAASGGSLAITTYTSGKLVLVTTHEGRIRFRTYKFPRPMGMAIHGKQLALAIRRRILLYKDTDKGKFTLQQEFATGKVDAHDVAFGRRGIYFANTRFNCIARAEAEKHFLRSWQPPFVPKSATRDHCHLNGLGMKLGRPAMATAFCATDKRAGWREDDRFTKGILIDIRQNKIIAEGLCMPHSPRWYKDNWWLCNSGHGSLMTFDEQSDAFREFCTLPGFTRGLCFVNDHALVGLSKIREAHVLDTPLVRESATRTMSGVALVDLVSSEHVGTLEFVRGGREVYEVVFLPGIEKPNFEEWVGDSRQ